MGVVSTSWALSFEHGRRKTWTHGVFKGELQTSRTECCRALGLRSELTTRSTAQTWIRAAAPRRRAASCSVWRQHPASVGPAKAALGALPGLTAAAEGFQNAFTAKAVMQATSYAMRPDTDTKISYNGEDISFDSLAPNLETASPYPTLQQVCKP